MRPHACCNVPANMARVELDERRAVETCGVCGRRHFEMTVDPAEFLGVLDAGARKD